MFDEKQIEEWRKDAKEQGPGIYNHMRPDFTFVHFRVDSKGRGQVPGRGVRVRHPDCTAQAAVDCVSGASCSASCFVVTPGVR